MSFSMITGNTQSAGVLSVSLTPASVGANTTAEQTFTVQGLLPTDFVGVSANVQNGVGIVGARVSANNTLAIRFSNNTAGGLTPTAGVYRVLVVRPGSAPTGFAP